MKYRPNRQTVRPVSQRNREESVLAVLIIIFLDFRILKPESIGCITFLGGHKGIIAIRLRGIALPSATLLLSIWTPIVPILAIWAALAIVIPAIAAAVCASSIVIPVTSVVAASVSAGLSVVPPA